MFHAKSNQQQQPAPHRFQIEGVELLRCGKESETKAPCPFLAELALPRFVIHRLADCEKADVTHPLHVALF